MDTATKTKTEELSEDVSEEKTSDSEETSEEAAESEIEEIEEIEEAEEAEEQKEESSEKKPSKAEKSPWDMLFPMILAVSLIVSLGIGFLFGALLRPTKQVEVPKKAQAVAAEVVAENGLPQWITEAYLTVDGVSRSGEKLEAVRDIAVHYVANPGSSAMANRNYFEGKESTTSSHFIVGLEGEVLILIPTDERSVATNSRNPDTISVEVCHPDATGKFSNVTYDSLIRLLAYLCDANGLTEENLIRHHDVTGKMCPLYYVEHPDEWETLKADVKYCLEERTFDDPAS